MKLAAFLAISFAGACYCSPYSSIVVYGDSLSDNGNLFAATGYPPAPYYNGRFSNGSVAVEDLAAMWHAALIDYAVAGATTGLGNFADGGTPVTQNALPGITAMYNQTRSTLAFSPQTLFIVWGGPNDFRSPAPGDAPDQIVARAATNILSITGGLRSAGAQNVLVVGMPDLGLIPLNTLQGRAVAAQATAATNAFNAAVQANLPPSVMFFDTASLLRAIVNNPQAYGFSNATDECFDGISVCATPNSYLFWDDQHPTAFAHALVASSINAQIAANAAPEPAAIGLTATGLVVLVIFARRGCATCSDV